MLNKKKKDRQAEEGQAMLEFVLVFPILMMIVVMVLDFGWLFYNQIQLENSSRNAARVACVEYNQTCLNKNGVPYSSGICEFDLNTMTDKADADRVLTEQENHLLNEVKNAVPGSVSDITVTVKYTYDKTYLDDAGHITFVPEDRSKGDVAVMVSGTHRAISPIVGWFDSDDSRMTRPVSTKAVYKVEKTSSGG